MTDNTEKVRAVLKEYEEKLLRLTLQFDQDVRLLTAAQAVIVLVGVTLVLWGVLND